MPPLGTNGAGDGPDKRTTAYENIFGRPTAKPKGPNNAYPANGPPIPAPVSQWVNQQAYLSGQPMPRYNGNTPVVGSSTPYRGAQNVYGYPAQQAQSQQDLIDRRASVTPSMSSQGDPRMSSYFAGGSAADAYGSGPSNHPSYYPPAAPPYPRTNTASPAPVLRPLPPTQGAIPSDYRHPSNAALPPYVRQPSHAESVVPQESMSPVKVAPRLPSFDLMQQNGSSDDLWFTNGNGNGSATAAGSNGAPHPTASPPLVQEEMPGSPGMQSFTVFSDGGDREDGPGADEGMYRNGEFIIKKGKGT